MNEKRVPFRHWLYLVAVAVATLVLSSAYAGKSQSADLGDRGFIATNTHLCQRNAITPKSVDMLEDWAALIGRLEAVGEDASKLSAEDNTLGAFLMNYCGTLAEGYRVILYRVDGDYALILFSEEYGFAPVPHIIRLSSFVPGAEVNL